ncbi:hypothetical protein K438DRAFT_1754787 [Mycena galopus ATCC 62051]|nr:hypothetical protein K438DRAFT_1754787 [Mycena galopus ATCC 62051]
MIEIVFQAGDRGRALETEHGIYRGSLVENEFHGVVAKVIAEVMEENAGIPPRDRLPAEVELTLVLRRNRSPMIDQPMKVNGTGSCIERYSALYPAWCEIEIRIEYGKCIDFCPIKNVGAVPEEVPVAWLIGLNQLVKFLGLELVVSSSSSSNTSAGSVSIDASKCVKSRIFPCPEGLAGGPAFEDKSRTFEALYAGLPAKWGGQKEIEPW